MTDHQPSRKRKVVIVSDEAAVIRLSQLREMYEAAGDLRTLGKALGLSISTISRALQITDSREPQEQRIERVRAMLTREGDTTHG